MVAVRKDIIIEALAVVATKTQLNLFMELKVNTNRVAVVIFNNNNNNNNSNNSNNSNNKKQID